MLTARPATRHLDGVTTSAASETLRRFGFHDHEPGAERIVMKKPGLRFSPRAHQRPMEATLVPREEGTELTLRYDAFVAFDTGDLEEHADRLARAAS
jgi:hypothetical protein